jgi:bis(5'-nucleosyl)-tetraphosphatase (symmetrical)
MPPGSASTRRRRRVFIGDLQGCADELEDLLEALAYDPTRHELFFVGDLVNRGPASARVLRRVMDLGASDTFQDVLEASDRDVLLQWLRIRPLVEAWDDAVLVHAGLHPRWGDPRTVAAPIEAAIASGEIPHGDADLDFLVEVRHCDADGNRPRDESNPGPRFAPWDRHYEGRRTVVCGHWAARGFVRTERVCSLDTGCVWGGALTAWIFEEDRFVSVPARASYQEIA